MDYEAADREPGGVEGPVAALNATEPATPALCSAKMVVMRNAARERESPA